MILIEVSKRKLTIEEKALRECLSEDNDAFVMGALQAIQWLRDGAEPPSVLLAKIGFYADTRKTI